MFDVGMQARALPGETLCGDATGFWPLPNGRALACMVDGLGHGQRAYQAARHCLSVVDQYRCHELDQIIRYCNDALGAYRGAAIGLARLDEQHKRVEYLGVGNIRACVVAHHNRWLINHSGILGNEPQLDLSADSTSFQRGTHTLFLASDGIDTALPYDSYRPSLYPNARELAMELVEDWSHDRDDAAMVVVR